MLSPGDGWVAYQVAFTGDPEADGLWVAAASGANVRRLDVFGAYRWRDEGRLVVAPLEPGPAAQRLVEVQASDGARRALTDPAVTPLRIAGGDWAISPDGRRVVFVSASDHNLWVLELNE